MAIPRQFLTLTCSIGFMIGFTESSQGQSPDFRWLRDEITYYSDIMVSADLDRHRARAHDSMKVRIETFLKKPGSFDFSLDSIPWLSVLETEDFRVVTWQYRVHDLDYHYEGFIQKADTVYYLLDNRPFVNGAEFSTYSPDAWYGCLYYDIKPFQREGKTYHALLGFHAGNRWMNTKLIDILDLNSDRPVLGVPVFSGKGDKTMNRILLQYADASTVHIRYDSTLNGFVHDHLESLPGAGPNGEALPVADGSLEAWIQKNGEWIYEEEAYDVIMEEPPMTDERKERKEDKDILGRPRKE